MKCQCPYDDNGIGNNEHEAYECSTKTEAKLYKREGQLIYLCSDCVLPDDYEVLEKD